MTESNNQNGFTNVDRKVQPQNMDTRQQQVLQQQQAIATAQAAAAAAAAAATLDLEVKARAGIINFDFPVKRKNFDHINDRELRKKLKNRESAQIARERAKAKMIQLERMVAELSEANRILEFENHRLKARLCQIQGIRPNMQTWQTQNPWQILAQQQVRQQAFQLQQEQIRQTRAPEKEQSDPTEENKASPNPCSPSSGTSSSKSSLNEKIDSTDNNKMSTGEAAKIMVNMGRKNFEFEGIKNENVESGLNMNNNFDNFQSSTFDNNGDSLNNDQNLELNLSPNLIVPDLGNNSYINAVKQEHNFEDPNMEFRSRFENEKFCKILHFFITSKPSVYSINKFYPRTINI